MRRKIYRLNGQWKFGLCTFILALISACFIGCDSSGRQCVEGTVTLDGKPLKKGNIIFRPKSDTISPSGGAKIVNGEFSIATKGGLLPGIFRVGITASRPTNKKIFDHFSGKQVTFDEQYIPATYNSKSNLEAVVEADSHNHFDFPLTLK